MITEIQRFLLAAEEGSITRTAEKIFITQSALTQSIQRLEKQIGSKLFILRGKSLEITTEGKAFVIVGNKILQLWENAKNTKMKESLKPSYSIGLYDNAALRLGQYIGSIIVADSYELELTINSTTKLFAQLNLGVLDAAVCVLSEKKKLPKNIILIESFSEELFPVSAKKFSGKIDEVPFLFYDKDSHTREQTDKVFADKDIKPKVFAESTSTSFMKELALLGSGVALLPKNFIKSELLQGTLYKQRLPLQWNRTYGLYINIEGSLNKNHTVVKDILEVLRKP